MSICCCWTRPAPSPSATARPPSSGRRPASPSEELADAALLASLADETPEGRSIVVLAKEKYGIRGREMAPLHASFIPFTAQTRMSGLDRRRRGDPQGRGGCRARRRQERPAWRRDGRARRSSRSPRRSPRAAARRWRCRSRRPACSASSSSRTSSRAASASASPTLRKMGIRTVMITGDNPLTAAAIAAEAGVDDFLAQATPEAKLKPDPRGAGRGQAGGHDRRRHQRCPGAGPGRCRRRHETPAPWPRGGRQYGGYWTATLPSSSRSWKSGSNS